MWTQACSQQTFDRVAEARRSRCCNPSFQVGSRNTQRHGVLPFLGGAGRAGNWLIARAAAETCQVLNAEGGFSAS